MFLQRIGTHVTERRKAQGIFYNMYNIGSRCEDTAVHMFYQTSEKNNIEIHPGRKGRI